MFGLLTDSPNLTTIIFLALPLYCRLSRCAMTSFLNNLKYVAHLQIPKADKLYQRFLYP